MTELPRTYKRPVEEVARALVDEDGVGHYDPPDYDCLEEWHKQVYCDQARAAIDTLRDLGFINDAGLAAIHAEEEANGQPRSVLPRYAPTPEQETR